MKHATTYNMMYTFLFNDTHKIVLFYISNPIQLSRKYNYIKPQ